MIWNMAHLVSEFHEAPVSFCVPLHMLRFAMHPTIHLKNKVDFRTEEVGNVAIYWNLSPKLQPKHFPIFQHLPHDFLRARMILPQLASTIRKVL
jgi:hypothetical protein